MVRAEQLSAEAEPKALVHTLRFPAELSTEQGSIKEKRKNAIGEKNENSFKKVLKNAVTGSDEMSTVANSSSNSMRVIQLGRWRLDRSLRVEAGALHLAGRKRFPCFRPASHFWNTWLIGDRLA